MESKRIEELSCKRMTSWFHVMVLFETSVAIGLGILGIRDAYWNTIFFCAFITWLGNLGVTAGAHRLWAHRSYKANTGLKIFLMLCHLLSGTGTIYNWVKLHRLHHKHFGTELDPYNPSKGFFYAHFKSYCLELSPAQIEALKQIDLSDLENDKVVMFQQKYFWVLIVLFSFLLPINAPAEYWGESMLQSVFVVGFLRCTFNMHLALLIHSATKILGLEAGEKYPSDTNLVFILSKTYWLSYHYLAPWDYQTGEYGTYGSDSTTKFIRVMQALEYAENLKVVDSETVRTALSLSADSKKPISECILDLYNKSNVDDDQVLFRPTKFM